jgi:hypothetical protein
VEEMIRQNGLTLLGCLPEDPEVETRAREGVPLLGAREDSSAYRALSGILEKQGVASGAQAAQGTAAAAGKPAGL